MRYLIAFFYFIAQTGLIAQPFISAETDSIVQVGIRHSIEQDYLTAEAIFTHLQETMPDNPIGYFFHAATLQSKMMDYESYVDEERFFDLAKQTVALAQKQLESQPQNPWARFFLGGGLGYVAFYLGKQGEFYEAFQQGMQSVKALESALRVDSTLYDAYFGLGTYKYFRSKFSRYLSWLPFVQDERAQGIKMIKMAIEKGKYSRYAAMNGFCWIAIDESYVEEGLKVARQALDEFPESRVFFWCAAKLSEKAGDWYGAIDYYQRILGSFLKDEVRSPYNEIICRRHIAEMYLKMGRYQDALDECETIAARKLNEPTQKRLTETLKKIEDIQKASNTHLIREAYHKSSN